MQRSYVSLPYGGPLESLTKYTTADQFPKFPTTAFGISNVVLSLTFGWNRHSWDIPIDHITKGLKLILAMEVLFVFAAALTKMSMLALTYRIMGDSHPWMARVVKVSALLIVLDLIALSFLDLFQCRFVFLAYQTQEFC